MLTYTTTRVFNIAHGAFGMVMAFMFWDFSQRQGLPTWLSLVLVLGVVAPGTGWLVQRYVTRGLGEGPVSVSLVVTVGLFVGLIGLAQQIWPPAPRTVPPFLARQRPRDRRHLRHRPPDHHDRAVGGRSRLGLYLLLNRTRIGTAMRASVDNPELLRLFGGKPDRVASLSWAIGISLGGARRHPAHPGHRARLLRPHPAGHQRVRRRDARPAQEPAADLRRRDGARHPPVVRRRLPADRRATWPGIRAVVPALFLFVVIVLMPQAQLRIGQVKGIVSAPLPVDAGPARLGRRPARRRPAARRPSCSDANLLLVGTAATYAMVMLSLVLLTGYGGHVSLAQFTFAGVGALAYAKLDQPNLYGLLLAALIAAGVGALVALPVLRLTGLYLALSTLAFGVLMDKMVFQADVRLRLQRHA